MNLDDMKAAYQGLVRHRQEIDVVVVDLGRAIDGLERLGMANITDTRSPDVSESELVGRARELLQTSEPSPTESLVPVVKLSKSVPETKAVVYKGRDISGMDPLVQKWFLTSKTAKVTKRQEVLESLAQEFGVSFKRASHLVKKYAGKNWFHTAPRV